jgi:hypothetical protein
MDERDEKLLAALLEIATEIRIRRVTVLSAIAPELRDDAGMKTREGYLRTEEMDRKEKL